jgi:cell shape-determining protein MreC
MKKLVALILVTLMFALLTVPSFATGAETSAATETTATETVTAAPETTIAPKTTAAVTIRDTTAATEPETYPDIFANLNETEAVTAAETTATVPAANKFTEADLIELAQFLAEKSGLSLTEAYEIAENMLTLADEYFGANEGIAKFIITLKQNPIILVLLIIIVSLFSGTAVMFLKARFTNSQTSKTLIKDYIEPSTNSFNTTATAMSGMEKTLASYSETIADAKRLAQQSDAQTEQIKALTEQNLTAERKRTAAYSAYTKAMELNAAMLNT